MGRLGINPAQPFLAVLRPLAAARLTMQREMRDISGDLKERADLLQGQIDSAEAVSGGDHRTPEGEGDPAAKT